MVPGYRLQGLAQGVAVRNAVVIHENVGEAVDAQTRPRRGRRRVGSGRGIISAQTSTLIGAKPGFDHRPAGRSRWSR